MTPDTAVLLHAGHGQLNGLEYLVRVLGHLVAFTAAGLVANWWLRRSDVHPSAPRRGSDADRH